MAALRALVLLKGWFLLLTLQPYGLFAVTSVQNDVAGGICFGWIIDSGMVISKYLFDDGKRFG